MAVSTLKWNWRFIGNVRTQPQIGFAERYRLSSEPQRLVLHLQPNTMKFPARRQRLAANMNSTIKKSVLTNGAEPGAKRSGATGSALNATNKKKRRRRR